MAAALTQNGLHVGFELRQKLHGHKGLYGAGKAAAVNADSARAVQVDDGYSGVSFNRPNFKKLEDAIRKGAIDCIVVKDLSRFSRNYL